MIPLVTAQRITFELLQHFAPACERSEVAGSVRRQKPEVHDIELVLQPQALAFDAALAAADASGLLQRDPDHDRDGPRYKRRLYHGSAPVDLFLVYPPAQWGLLLFIRTGPAEFGQRALATWKRLSGGYSKEGCLHDAQGRAVPTPEEADVFAALGWPWLDPQERRG